MLTVAVKPNTRGWCIGDTATGRSIDPPTGLYEDECDRLSNSGCLLPEAQDLGTPQSSSPSYLTSAATTRHVVGYSEGILRPETRERNCAFHQALVANAGSLG